MTTLHKPQVFIFYQNLLIADALQCFLDRSTDYCICGVCQLREWQKQNSSAFAAADIVIYEVDNVCEKALAHLKEARAINTSARYMLIADTGKESMSSNLLRNGIMCYLLRCCTGKDLFLKALENLRQGNNYYCSAVTQSLLNECVDATACKQEILTEREIEILTHLADELSTRQIASKLFLSPATVKTHRRNIMRKLSANNVFTLLRSSLDKGILSRKHIPLCRQCDFQKMPKYEA